MFRLLPLLGFAFAAFHVSQAATFDLYIATGGKGIPEEPSGTYHASFDPVQGLLTTPTLAAEVPHPSFLAIEPKGRFLFSAAPHDEAPGVASYVMEEEGGLTRIHTQSSEGQVPCHLHTDLSGRTLLVANFRDGRIASLPITEHGELKPAATIVQHEGSSILPRQQSPHPHSIYPGPHNRFVYVPDLGMDKVMIYRLDPDNATLTAAGEAQLPPGSGPRHMAFSFDGRHAYLLNEIGLNVAVFARGHDGSLTLTQTIPTVEPSEIPPRMIASEIRVHPSGPFVYTANRGGGGADSIAVFEIAIFEIDPQSGTLTFTGRKVPVRSPVSLEFPEPAPELDKWQPSIRGR